MRSSPADRNVLIVARSGGMLARAAAGAGYRPHVIDLFGDADTSSAAAAVHVVRPLPGLRLDPAAVIAAVAQIGAEYGPMPLVWGSGLEVQPHLLAALEQRVAVAGCSAETLFGIVDPVAFSRTLDRLRIPHPEVRFGKAPGAGRWLVKTAGGCGGAHVRDAIGHTYHEQRQYFQALEIGSSMSVTFIADAEGIQVLGFVEHLRLQPDPDAPFRYGGAVACPPLGSSVEKRVEEYARRLAAHYRLQGLCGIDFVLSAVGSTRILELNPRPTATFGLLSPAHEAFAAHMTACLHGRRLYSRIARDVGAQAVVYASEEIYMGIDAQWPAWVADRPRPGTCAKTGEPLCSITVAAATSAAARRLLERRFGMLQRWITRRLAMARAGQTNIDNQAWGT